MTQEKRHNITSIAKLVVSVRVMSEGTNDLWSEIALVDRKEVKMTNHFFKKRVFFKNPRILLEILNFDQVFDLSTM